MDELDKLGRFGGPARLPLALAGVLLAVAIGLLVLVAIGATREDPAPETSETVADQPSEPVVADNPVEAPDPAGAPAAEPPAAAPAPAGPPEGDDPVSSPPVEEGISVAPPSPPGSEPSGQSAAPSPEEAAEKTPEPPSSEAGEQTAALPPPPPILPEVGPLALPPAPDPALVEPSPQGPLPRIGPDGRKPWEAYARPFDRREDRPRVAVVVSGLGLSSAATEAAIQGLPGEVTLAFQPFADNLQQWIRLARAAGHEVLLNLPMEPVDYPESDPGPQALFVTLSPDENVERLRWALSRVSGYVGVLNHMGSRFTTSREAMVPILDELKQRGLLFVDARASARSVATVLASERRVPRAINDRYLDAREVSRATIDARLEEVERIAEETGVSVAVGQAFPVTIERIRVWADSLDERRVVLVPISAVVDRQGDR